MYCGNFCFYNHSFLFVSIYMPCPILVYLFLKMSIWWKMMMIMIASFINCRDIFCCSN